MKDTKHDHTTGGEMRICPTTEQYIDGLDPLPFAGFGIDEFLF